MKIATWALLGMTAVSAAYHLLAWWATLRHRRQKRVAIPARLPGISILKPVRGLDPHFLQAIRSHAEQRYPGEFEILFGVADAADPAIAVIEQLQREYPGVTIRLVHSTTQALNGKVGCLIDLAREARHSVMLVNDSDILVPTGYLATVVAELTEDVGIVTCVYRAHGDSWPAKWEAFGIRCDFAPSTLVAPVVGVREFGLGATLVFRRADLEAIGGFEALKDYLADDYQLARHIVQKLGKRARMSSVIVDTFLGDDDWARVWAHQVRWARTIRVSRGDGYLGLPVTHAGVWVVLCLLAGQVGPAVALFLVRCGSATAAGVRLPFLAVAWDWWAFAVYVAGLTGRTVDWRGMRLQLQPDGRLH